MNEEQEFSRLLLERSAGVGSLSPAQVSELCAHYALLLRWNRVLNLTSIRKLEEAVERHYCESLFLGAQLPAGGISVLDVGSGAGFPGFPVAVLRPDARVVLVEAHQRKAVFLKEAARGRANVRVEAQRAAPLSDADWVVSRAVRWQDVVPVASRQIALLLGAGDAEEAAGCEGVCWKAPIALPWGRSRVLLIGRRSTWNVS